MLSCLTSIYKFLIMNFLNSVPLCWIPLLFLLMNLCSSLPSRSSTNVACKNPSQILPSMSILLLISHKCSPWFSYHLVLKKKKKKISLQLIKIIGRKKKSMCCFVTAILCVCVCVCVCVHFLKSSKIVFLLKEGVVKWWKFWTGSPREQFQALNRPLPTSIKWKS